MINKYFSNLFISTRVCAYAISFLTLGIIILLMGCKDSTKQGSLSKEDYTSDIVIIDSVFINSLDRWRSLRVYLPKGYNTSNEMYPVVYMLDGQNLFEDSTSYAGEWHIDESMDSLARLDIPQAIVIGIDNGQELRMNEYNPFDSERFGPGEGKETMDFIVNQLKPMVDSMYRTKPERGYTTLGGSSMGGLMAFYAMSDYSEVFSKAIVFSPSFWISDQVEKWIPSLMKDTKIYMSMGSEEGEEMISEMNRMIELMKESGLGQDQLRTRLVNGMGHNEKLWTMEYPQAYQFLFGKGNQ